jgi:hypothetical protein
MRVSRQVWLRCKPSRYKQNGHRHNGKQNYHCHGCGRQFVKCFEQYLISAEKRSLIERVLVERILLWGIYRDRRQGTSGNCPVAHDLGSAFLQTAAVGNERHWQGGTGIQRYNTSSHRLWLEFERHAVLVAHAPEGFPAQLEQR